MDLLFTPGIFKSSAHPSGNRLVPKPDESYVVSSESWVCPLLRVGDAWNASPKRRLVR